MTRHAFTAAAAALLITLAACAGGDQEASPAGGADTMATGAAAPEPPAAQSVFLDPDAASREDLLAIAGMDSAAADAVVSGRPYASVTALDSALAPHLSESERDSVYTRLWRPIDLNSASDAEILMIPGVGDRMLHEFKEYRPYTSMEQFRREIGKYVDDEEVARLESYVTIR
ncbi:MAG: hypothetical protein M3Y31_00645 [Gemmatimonadota bacterium]|nr:hypothetical protein [Gemmatimonadota bacterium]